MANCHEAQTTELLPLGQRHAHFLPFPLQVNTRLPIHVVVGPERDEKKEQSLVKLGVQITVGPFVKVRE